MPRRLVALQRPHLFTTSQVAVALNISKRTLERLIKAGKVLPPPKAENGYYYWSARDLDDARQALKGGAVA
jgi:DNA-binding transcriptional MerR regulator